MLFSQVLLRDSFTEGRSQHKQHQQLGKQNYFMAVLTACFNDISVSDDSTVNKKLEIKHDTIIVNDQIFSRDLTFFFSFIKIKRAFVLSGE